MHTAALSGAPIIKHRRLAAAIVLAAFACLPPASHATDDSRVIAIGVLGHDQGPASDHHEHGIDLNLEVQFAPLDFWGTPRPHLGATLNFIGDTSVAYAGLTFPVYRHKNWLLDGFISAVAHDGPLHKDREGCRRDSDCGYGVRVMPRFGLELGYRLNDKSAISVFYDHMSHYWIIDAENEGLEHTGLRYLFSF
ncbi:acyloxyacyl hydrolase [Betaproteobacteria bacterium SCN2]|jgi:lipid A 3-O-deacylase|nr:acyloxyacyl hydrolase [Betaproteobacteria bacterium SCN2]